MIILLRLNEGFDEVEEDTFFEEVFRGQEATEAYNERMAEEMGGDEGGDIDGPDFD